MEIKYNKQKEEMRKDPVMDFLVDVKKKVESNTNSIIGIVAAALIIFGGVMAYNTMKKSSLSKAQDAFGKAMIAYSQNDQKKSMDALMSVNTEYKGTPYGFYSAYILGQMFMQGNQIDEAITWFKSGMSKDASTGFVGAECMEAIGVCFEKKKDAKQALEWYEKALADERIAYRHGILRWRIALLSKEVGTPQKAVQMCQAIIADSLSIDYREKADNLLAEITAGQ